MSESRLFTRPFLILWTFYFLVFVAGYQLFPLVPFRLRELGAGLAESGWFMAAFTIGSGIGGLVTGSLGDRLGQRRVLRGATLFSVLFFVAYAFCGFVGASWCWRRCMASSGRACVPPRWLESQGCCLQGSGPRA